MRGKLGLIAASVALAGVVGGSAPVASSDIQQPETINTIATFTKFKFVDNPPLRQESAGDVFIFRVTLSRGGSHVGFGVVECRSMFPRNLAQCLATFKLPRGRIAVQGLVDVGAQRVHEVLPITGGSQGFANVRGELEVQDISENKSRFTFRLQP